MTKDTMTFSKQQMTQIELGQQQGVDVSLYAKEKYYDLQMQEIRLGLCENLPVENYLDPQLDWLQMQEIRKGLRDGVDVSLYAQKEIPHEKMNLMRKGLKKGYNLKKYLTLDPDLLRQMLVARDKHINIDPYVKQGYNAEQLGVIMDALERHIDMRPYLSTQYRGVALKELEEGLVTGIDVAVYADPKYTWQKMREIRLGLENRIDVTKYLNVFYSPEQMRQIRLGLQENLDVSSYASLMYTADDMKRKRIAMREGRDIHYASNSKTVDPAELDRSCGFAVSISNNHMEGYVICDGSGAYGSSEEIMTVLHQHGIVAGIDQKVVSRMASGEDMGLLPVQIATGRKPQKGTDGWYQYFFEQEVAKTPKILENGNVDYQNIKWFEIVEKDQKIVEYHSAQKGTDGITVDGKALPGYKGKELPMLRGRGFYLSEDRTVYYSEMDGRIENQDGNLVISRVFVFPEITMATGNVNEDGNVYIKGNVGANTCIRATGDIVIDGFIEGAHIESGGDILLRKGVNAGMKGVILAGGSVAGKFFETANVRAEGNINAEYSFDSNLEAGGFVTMEDGQGSIIGGRVYAARGISANHIGNEAGKETYLNFGVQKKTYQDYEVLKGQLEEVEKELTIFTNAYREYTKRYTVEERCQMKMFTQIQLAIDMKQHERKDLLEEQKILQEKIEEGKSAFVSVRLIYENVFVESGQLNWRSTKLKQLKIRIVGNRIAFFQQ